MKRDRLLRREKSDPNADAIHTMRVGLVVLVMLVLPGLMLAHRAVEPDPPDGVSVLSNDGSN